MKRDDPNYKYKPYWSHLDEVKLIISRLIFLPFIRKQRDIKHEGLVIQSFGYKVGLLKNIEKGGFEGISFGGYYLDGKAHCIRSGWHRPPAHWCSCGFHAFKEKVDAYKLFNRVRNLDKVFLVVDLFGQIVEHEYGFRAEEQIITKIYLPSNCQVKKCSKKTVGYGFYKKCNSSLCSSHLTRGVSLQQLSALLKLPVALIKASDVGL